MAKAKEINKTSQIVNNIINNLKRIDVKSVAIIAIIIMSFIIGRLSQKVEDIEKGISPANNVAQAGNNAAAAPTPAPLPLDQVGGAGHLPVLGNKDAKVTITEFADFRCPYCAQFFNQTESQIIKNYVDTGKVKFAFRHYAFLGPASVVASDAAECAADQGKFWEFHDYLYKNQPDESNTSMYNTDTLTKAAASLGLNTAKFRTCLDTKADDGKVTQDFTDAQKAGVAGTPAIFVNNVLVPGGAQPYAVFQQAIDAALK